MKKNQVKAGSVYLAKVSGKVVKVRILYERGPFMKGWTARNLETGREVWIKTAARLRSEVTE